MRKACPNVLPAMASEALPPARRPHHGRKGAGMERVFLGLVVVWLPACAPLGSDDGPIDAPDGGRVDSGVPDAGSVRMTWPCSKSLLDSVRWAVRNPAWPRRLQNLQPAGQPWAKWCSSRSQLPYYSAFCSFSGRNWNRAGYRRNTKLLRWYSRPGNFLELKYKLL